MTRHFSRIAVVLFVLLLGAAPAFAQTAASEAAKTDPASWSAIYPILGWLPLFGANVDLPSGPPCDGCPPDSTSGDASNSGLSGAWFAGGRLEFNRFSVTANYNYAGLSAERDAPLFKADVKLYAAAVLGGVRVYGPLFLDGGARYYGLHATLNLHTFPSIDWDPGQWSPALGATFRPALGKKWRLYTHIDWGGLGTSRVSTANAEARVEWRPITHFALSMGWSFAKVTFDDTIRSRPIHFSETLNGPLFGLGIPF